jgi:hypothetical protein
MSLGLPLLGDDVDKYAEFWKWFEINQDKFFDFAKPDQKVEKDFDLLSGALGKVNGDLTFEFGPKAEIREFVISAGGLKKSFPDVVLLAKAAPILPKWKVIQFRPRRSTLNIIDFQGVKLDPKALLSG